MSTPLDVFLSRYPATFRPLGPPEPMGNAGGTSGARLWRFRSGRGILLVRAWPADGPDRTALERVHGWLADVGGLGFVPIPIPDLEGRTLQDIGGRLWELTPWMPGVADLARSPDRGRVRAGFGALAALHQRLARHRVRGPSPGLAGRLLEVDELRLVGFDRLEDLLDRKAPDPMSVFGRRWLDLARRLAAPVGDALRRVSGLTHALQPCVRDARPDHFLFEGDRLTGLVDFGAMGIESVACDLARLLAEWLGPDRLARSEALASYGAIRPLDPAEVALIETFESSAALLGAGRWIRWHFVEGRVFDDPSLVERGLRRALDRIERLAADRRGA